MPLLLALKHLLFPLLILLISFTYLLKTLHHYVSSLTFPRSFKELQNAWFTLFWTDFLGPGSTTAEAPIVAPLLSEAYGRVLDLGTGSGLTLKYLDPEKISSLVAVEPVIQLHKLIHENAENAGFGGGKLELVVKGAGEYLFRSGGEEEFDTIIANKFFCGVPDARKVAGDVWGCLKPGGQLLVFEHVGNEKSLVVGVYQSLLTVVWRIMVGGCELDRDTGRILRSAGEWERDEVDELRGEMWYHPMPHFIGRLVKTGGGGRT